MSEAFVTFGKTGIHAWSVPVSVPGSLLLNMESKINTPPVGIECRKFPSVRGDLQTCHQSVVFSPF